MKESIEGTTLIQIVMVFLFVFTAIICVSLNYSNAFKTKNDLIKYIERHGIDAAKDEKYIEYLKKNGYTTTGDCPDEPITIKKKDGTSETYNFEPNSAQEPLFCYRLNSSGGSYEMQDKSKYYDIIVFYKIDVPLLNKISFKVRGSTKTIYN